MLGMLSGKLQTNLTKPCKQNPFLKVLSCFKSVLVVMLVNAVYFKLCSQSQWMKHSLLRDLHRGKIQKKKKKKKEWCCFVTETHVGN